MTARELVPRDAAPTDADVAQLAARLRLTVARLGRRLRQEAGGPLSPSMVSALATIDRQGEVTLGDLAAAERVQPSSITAMVGKLEGAGHVERRPDPADGRVTWIRLTAQGKRLLERERARKTAFLTRRLSQLEPDDVAALARAVDVLERLMEEQR
ncbi:MAG: MarR family transcriptional regulator [Actinomycetota bacterium]|nr:MarR family transcriptional regulator [Actinomycetota bacterium]